MHDHSHEPNDADFRPRGDRVEREDPDLIRRAVEAGRPDVLGPPGLLGLQRSVGNSGVGALVEQERSPVLDVVGSGGSPLDTETRVEMESRLGQDFSDVRIHTDGAAHESARSVNAHAYTVGSDIVFQHGTFDPSSAAGKHTLAHELTHVVQQRSGPVDGTDLGDGVSVSDPSDRFEREAVATADRVMSAPVPMSPAPGSAEHGGGHSERVQRDAELHAPTALSERVDTAARTMLGTSGHRRLPVQRDSAEDAAAEGEAQVVAEQKQARSVVLKVSNDQDIAAAEMFLKQLNDDQSKLEMGAMQPALVQDLSVATFANRILGRENKSAKAVPASAVSDNMALMSDLRQYLVHARHQRTGASQFKQHYAVLLRNFGRIEGIASKFAGTSLHEMGKEGAAGLVQNAAGASGMDTEQLSSAFNEMLANDPDVRGAREKLGSVTAEFERMPADLTSKMQENTNAIATFDMATATASSAQTAFNADEAVKALGKAKESVTNATADVGKIRGVVSAAAPAVGKTDPSVDLILAGGAGDAVGQMLKGATDGQRTVGGILAKGVKAGIGGAAGGPAGITTAVVDELGLKPAREAAGDVLRNANAAAGYIDEATSIEWRTEVAGKTRDQAIINTWKEAAKTLKGTAKAVETTTNAYLVAAVAFESKRSECRNAFTNLSTAIQKAAGRRGKEREGKALGEMVTFLKESEEFVVQAAVVLDIAEKEMSDQPAAAGSDDPNSVYGPKATREALQKWDGRRAWQAYEYERKFEGQLAKGFGAQEIKINVNTATNKTDEERRGHGTADGSAGANDMAVNAAIPTAVKNVQELREKVLAVRAQISSQVFGGGG